MKRILFFLLFLSSATAFSQTIVFKGRVMDTSEKKPLHNAVVSLISGKDSSLTGFKRTDKEGNFLFSNVPAGKYNVLVSYPKFADMLEEVDLTADKNFGNIALTPVSALLSEVIVRSGQAIRIKGDTTEFTADSFLVKDGATVEDLMKKLPGFQVNSKGEITAQGKRVDKVLVDGEEFFGDDPTMATQNISSKAVDKVQVYDTKTEQQNLTGLTTGNEGKTINIKLKDSHKKGSFGKAHIGSDFSKYIDAKALYNQFVGKKKVSAYGTKSNLNTGSLNWEDRQKLGMEENMEFDEIGGFYYSFGTDDGFSDWSLRGLPDSYSAGGLYSNKFNQEKQSVNLSYRFNRLGTENEGQTNIFYTGPGNYRNTFTSSNGWNEQHAVNGKYEWKLDSLTSLKITSSALRKTTDLFSKNLSEFLDSTKKMINNTDQTRITESVKQQTDNVLTYRQMFNKKNRLLIGTLRYGVIDDEGEGTYTTVASYVFNSSTNITDQMKTSNGNSKTLGGKITFNEPLNDKFNLVLDYGYNRNHSLSYKNSYNKSSGGKYDQLDTIHSNNFDLEAYSHSAMAVLKYVGKKTRFAFGSGVSDVKLNLTNLDSAIKNEYDFLKLTPQAQFNYTFKPQTSISFNYRGTTRQPTINQLQPLRDNSDPVNQFVGNPDLKVGFNHNMSMFFNQYKVLSRRGVWISFSYNIQNNAIVNSTVIDPATGNQSYSPLNVNGVHNWYTWAEWNKGGGEKKPSFGISVNGNGGRNISFLNNIKQETNYSSLSIGPSVSIDSEEKYSLSLRPNIGLNYSTTSAANKQDFERNYMSYGGNVNGFVMLPGKLELRSDVNFDLREKTEGFGDNINIIQWNAFLSKKVFKKKTGKIILQANDILNQNRGFDRMINSYQVSENRYSRVGQYVLLKFEWSFNKMPGEQTK